MGDDTGIPHLTDLLDATPARARRSLAELRRELERIERKLRRDDRDPGQMLRQSLVDELRILALEYEMTSDAERVQVARLIRARFLELAVERPPAAPARELSLGGA